MAKSRVRKARKQSPEPEDTFPSSDEDVEMDSDEEAVVDEDEEDEDEYMEESDSVEKDNEEEEEEDDEEEEGDADDEVDSDDEEEEDERALRSSARGTRSRKATTRVASPPSLRSSRENLGLRSRKAVNYNEVEVIGQRPTRAVRSRTKRRTVVESSDEEEEEDEAEEGEGEEEEVTPAQERLPEPALDVSSLVPDFDTTEEYEVDKILSHRDKKGSDETEYLVKWKRRSYAQCEWVGPETFDDRLSQGRLKRYLDKNPLPYEDIDEPFHSSYTTADRIVSHKYRKGKIKYLVKWRQLQYSDSTWEWPEDIDDDALIEEYKKRLVPPPASSTKIQPRRPNSWKKYTKSPEYKDEHELRPYQLEGLNWLTFCWHHNRNSILADEMGLGKTVQTVSVINYLFTEIGVRGPFLIVAPLITIPHWKREFENWTNMSVVVHHGTKDSREIIRRSEFYFNKGQARKRSEPYKFNVLITTYEMTLADSSLLSGIRWRYLAIDEAHRLKNKDCRLITTLRTFRFDHLLLLTGTPLQNNTEELWTLLNFMEPKKFESLEEFLDEFGELKEATQVEKLHEILRPYLLRRMKEDVEKSIAPKEETIVEVELTATQKKYYRAIFERNFQSLDMGAKASNLPSLMNVMMQLRKCCNHPFLLKGVEENIIENARSDARSKLQLPDEAPDPDVNVENLMIEASGKLFLIDRLLPKLRAGGHRVLIFSQMVRMLDILEDYAQFRNFPYERIDGSKRGNDRQAAIDRFSAPDSDRFLFFLCTRAGGLGINLTAADTCIIYDSDWNPQNDIQAQARCHRIGQTQSVKIYRLVTRNTYEKYMLENASRKLGLDQAVLKRMKGAGRTSAADEEEAPPLDKKQIDTLLKHGAYGAFLDDENSQDNFTEEDIDKILGRCSSTVVHESGTNGPSTFSKASFCATANAETRDVDVNDPDFWTKLMPNAKMEDPLIQYEPRRRRQVQRFGGIDEDGDVFDIDEDSELEYQDEEATQGWTNRERARLKTFLLEYGYGQWRTVRLFAKLDRWSLAEVKEYTDCLLSRFLDELGEENTSEVLELIQNNFIPEKAYPEEGDDDVEDPSDKTTVAEAPTEAPDVEMMDSANPHAADSATTEPQSTSSADSTAVSDDVNDTAESDGSGEKESVDSIEAMDTDGAKAESDEETDAKGTKSELDSSSSDVDADGNGDNEKTQNQFEDDPSLNDDVFEVYKQRNARLVIKRLEGIAKASRSLMHLVSTYGDTLDIPDVGGDLPTSWWTKEDDKSAIIGAFYHGYAQYELMRFDPRLTFLQHFPKAAAKKALEEAKEREEKAQEESEATSTQSTDDVVMTDSGAPQSSSSTTTVTDTDVVIKDIETAEEKPSQDEDKGNEEEEEEWPLAKVLTRRLRKVLRALGIAYQGIERKQKAKLKKEENEQKKGRKRKGQVTGDWSKRERLDLYRTIVTFGLPEKGGKPDWNFVKEKAKLSKKSEEHIEECYRALVAQAEETVKLGRDPPRLQLAASTGGEGDAEDTLSLQQCKRVLHRLKLFKDLRTRVLSARGRLADLLKGTPSLQQLPLWWRPEIHDVALVKGTVKHGFGKWEKICSDPSLPFYSLARERLALQNGDSPEDQTPGMEGCAVSIATSDSHVVTDGSQESKDDEENETKKKPKRGRKAEVYTTALHFPKDKSLTKRLEQIIRQVIHEKKPKQQLTIKELLLTPEQKTEQKLAGEKRKRPKATVKKKYVDVPLNEDGTPQMPIVVGNVTVLSLGRVEYERDSYSNWRYIWPIGYKSTRMHFSFQDPLKKIMYTSEILDGGPAPVFRVTAEDCPEEPCDGSSPSAAWSMVLRRVAKARGEMSPIVKKRSQFAVSGPDFFGVSTGTIAKLLQEMPNAHLCTRYGMQQFEKREPGRTSKIRKTSPSETPAARTVKNPQWHNATISAMEAATQHDLRVLPHPVAATRTGIASMPVHGITLAPPRGMMMPVTNGATTLAPFNAPTQTTAPLVAPSGQAPPVTRVDSSAHSLTATETIDDFDDNSRDSNAARKAAAPLPTPMEVDSTGAEPSYEQQPSPSSEDGNRSPAAFGFTHANGRSVNILSQSPQ